MISFKQSKKFRIWLTTLVLMLLAPAAGYHGGSLDAATPTLFASTGSVYPNGIYITRDQLLITDYCTGNIVSFDSCGNATLFSTIPGVVSDCLAPFEGNIFDPQHAPPPHAAELYIAISPGLGGFTANEVFVTYGANVYRIPAAGGAASLFATIPAAANFPFDHNGIMFDEVGTFGFKLIVTAGPVPPPGFFGSSATPGQFWTIDSLGNKSCVLGNVAGCLGTPIVGGIEAPEVIPTADLGPAGGTSIVTSENNNTVYGVSNAGVVSTLASWPSVEVARIVPTNICTFGRVSSTCGVADTGGAFFTTLIFDKAIDKLSSSDLAGLSGQAILSSEFAGTLGTLSWNGTNFVTSTLATGLDQQEGGAVVDCSVPLLHCVVTFGFWKTHYPSAWPASVISGGMTLGTVLYTAAQLESILNQPVGGNGLISLAHQLIGAKLNIAAGNPAPPAVLSAISSADALIGGLVIPPVGSGFLSPASTSSLVDTLTNYNQGTGGPLHCPSF